MHTKCWSEDVKGKYNLEDIGVDGRVILDCILRRVGSCGLDASGSGYGSVAGCCEHGSEALGSIEGGKFLD
jgi:hypothetical protein